MLIEFIAVFKLAIFFIIQYAVMAKLLSAFIFFFLNWTIAENMRYTLHWHITQSYGYLHQ